MQLNSKMSGKVDLREIRGDFKKSLKKIFLQILQITSIFKK
jgi:ribosomal protein S3AE